MALTVGSLFAGIGGFDLGFSRCGFQVKWQVEIEPFCRTILATRYPQAVRYEDVCRMGSATLAPVDVIVAGVPCQDVSIAGRRQGLRGVRTGLFFEFARIVREMIPLGLRWAVMENVPGLLSSHDGRDFHTVLATLAECGLRRSYRILDSQYFGLAQRRKRVFLVGHTGAVRDGAAAVLVEPKSRAGDPQTREEASTAIAACLRGRSHGVGVNEPGRGGEDDQNLICFDWKSAGDVRHNYSSSSSNSLQASQTPAVFQCHGTNVGPLGTLRKGDGGVTSGVPFVAATLNSGGHVGGFRTEPGEHLVASTILGCAAEGLRREGMDNLVVNRERERALVGSMGKHHDDDTDTLICFDDPRRFSDAHRGLIHGDVHPTLNTDSAVLLAGTLSKEAGRNRGLGNANEDSFLVASPVTASAGHHGHSSARGDGRDNLVPHNGVRRLTPLECERLQGFPDGWTCLCGHGHRGSTFCTCKDSARYRALGNAVSVPVAEWIAQRIAAVDQREHIA